MIINSARCATYPGASIETTVILEALPSVLSALRDTSVEKVPQLPSKAPFSKRL